MKKIILFSVLLSVVFSFHVFAADQFGTFVKVIEKADGGFDEVASKVEKSLKCPGLDHGSAFPIEVVVYRESGKIKVVTLDEMYRMKLYFEDAGMWAFIKNMRMPGRIENKVTDMASSMLEK